MYMNVSHYPNKQSRHIKKKCPKLDGTIGWIESGHIILQCNCCFAMQPLLHCDCYSTVYHLTLWLQDSKLLIHVNHSFKKNSIKFPWRTSSQCSVLQSGEGWLYFNSSMERWKKMFLLGAISFGGVSTFRSLCITAMPAMQL